MCSLSSRAFWLSFVCVRLVFSRRHFRCLMGIRLCAASSFSASFHSTLPLCVPSCVVLLRLLMPGETTFDVDALVITILSSCWCSHTALVSSSSILRVIPPSRACRTRPPASSQNVPVALPRVPAFVRVFPFGIHGNVSRFLVDHPRHHMTSSPFPLHHPLVSCLCRVIRFCPYAHLRRLR